MGKLMQYIAMFSGSSWVMITGINLGWASPYLPVLQSEESPVGPVTSDDAFWCSVMPLVGAIPGALLAGFLTDRLGRKPILVSLSPLCLCCLLAIAFTTRLWVIDVARFFIGTIEGATYAVLPMYYGEIAEPKIRGAMSSSILVGAVSGLLLINVVGSYTDIFTSSLISCLVPIIYFCTFIWMPRSPYFLIKEGRIDEAHANLRRLRSGSVETELKDLVAAVKRQQAVTKSAKFTDLFTIASNRRAVYIYLMLAMANKFSGSNPVMFYTQTIFEEANGILPAKDSVILFHILGFISTLAAANMMDRFGRRPLMLGSVIGCGCALALIAAYFTFEILHQFNWIPLVALISYYCVFNLGICLGPVVFLSELFPVSVKGYALGAADSVSVTLGTLASKIFHTFSEMYGMHTPFWMFSCACLVLMMMIYAFVPETKGKTLDEIQLELIGESKTIKHSEKKIVVAVVDASHNQV